MIKENLTLFWIALAFFSRIPVPADLACSAETMNHSSRYYAVAGLVIGLFLTLLLIPFHFFLPTPLVAVLLTGCSLLITGAFHEDGFADMCDGFGGGFTKEKKLEIMKDSRLGTFGGAGLFMELAIQTVALNFIIEHSIALAIAALLSLHSLSRGMSGIFIFFLPDQRKLDELSKAKPLATGMRTSDLIVLIITALLPGFILLKPELMVSMLVFGGIFFFWFRAFLLRHLGGFTGDCLGAAQIIFYISGLLIISSCIKFNTEPESELIIKLVATVKNLLY